MKQSLVIFWDLCLRKTRYRQIKSLDYHDIIVSEKASFSKCFPSTRKRKAGVFRFLWFEERLSEAPFL